MVIGSCFFHKRRYIYRQNLTRTVAETRPVRVFCFCGAGGITLRKDTE